MLSSERSKSVLENQNRVICHISVHVVNHNIYIFLRVIWQKKYMVLSNFSAILFFMLLIAVNNFTSSQNHTVYWNKQFCDRHVLVLYITCKFQYVVISCLIFLDILFVLLIFIKQSLLLFLAAFIKDVIIQGGRGGQAKKDVCRRGGREGSGKNRHL